jgi:hypothetical protein
MRANLCWPGSGASDSNGYDQTFGINPYDPAQINRTAPILAQVDASYAMVALRGRARNLRWPRSGASALG